MNKILSRLIFAWSRLWNDWNQFWFADRDLLPLGLFRFFFGLNLLIMYSLRHLRVENYFTAASPVPQDSPFEIIDPALWPSVRLYEIVASRPEAWHAVFLGLIICLCVGFFGRLAALGGACGAVPPFGVFAAKPFYCLRRRYRVGVLVILSGAWRE